MIPIDFLSAPTHENVRILLCIWLALFGLLLWHQWNSPNTFGLPLVYAFGFSLIHLGGALAYSFDHYSPRSAYLIQCGNSLTFSHAGMWTATLGFLSFCVGVLLCNFLSAPPQSKPPRLLHPQINQKLPVTLLFLSLAFFFLIGPIVRRIPSVGALATGGVYLSIVAIYLLCHRTYYTRQLPQFFGWFASTFGFPLFTVTFMGFMSFGTSAAMAVWMLVLRFFRPRWLSIILIVSIVFIGVSTFVNWTAYRDYIRKGAWGNAPIKERLTRIVEVAKISEVFNSQSQQHLESLDARLNQGDFVGKAMAHTGTKVPFAGWNTAWIATTAWIPRIIWPTKPKYGGSGNLVTFYTGQPLSETSSFGVGQVLEFYVSAGFPTVILGFLVLGYSLSFIDVRAASHLRNGDYWNLTRWILPSLGLIQPNGALGEIVSAFAANSVLVFLLHHAMFKKYYPGDAIAGVLHHPSFRSQAVRGSKSPRSISRVLPHSSVTNTPPQQPLK